MDVVIKILALLNNCFILWIMTCHTMYLHRAHHKVVEDIKKVNTFGRLLFFIKDNSKYLSTQMQRLSLIGIFLINISQLNTGYLKIKPDIQFVMGSMFYISYVWSTISSYRREQDMIDEIKELKNKIK